MISIIYSINAGERNSMGHKNGKKSHACGLEKLILLKWPYYTKWSIDSMQFSSNINVILPRKRKKSKIQIEP
jgi:hypothetical protein